MSIQPSQRDYEEFVGDVFPIPRGRLVGAELHVLPFSTSGSSAPKDDTLKLHIEVRTRPEAEFESVAASPVLSQYEETTSKVLLPLREAEVPDENGNTPGVATEPGPVARFRLVHAGKQSPRYSLRLISL